MERKCKLFKHKWNGCICEKCGKTRHKWKLYYDNTWESHEYYKCKCCGKIKIELEEYVSESESSPHPCERCPYFDTCPEDESPSSCHYNRD